MKRYLGSLFMGDRVIWVVYFFLCVISLVEVYSAASTLVYKSGSFWPPLVKQIVFIIIGTIIVIGVHRLPCRYFKMIPIILLPGSVVLMIVTMMGGGTNSASRWYNVGGLFTFQPSELAKGAVILTVALILSRMQHPEGADKRAMKFILFVTGVVCLFILPENLSTSALLFGVVVLMMFVGRVPMSQLGKLIGVIALVGGFALGLLYYEGHNHTFTDTFNKVSYLHRFETWANRVADYTTPGDDPAKTDPMKFDLDDDAQEAHARIAIASSNFIGKMPGNSVERDFLSQAFSDFIFSIIIEEMGLWGAVIVVLLYVILLFRAGRIASRCERNFPPFLVLGLTLLMVSQAMLNMMVAVGLFPITGQPLPLISRGGTSMLINCVYIGMILSVSRYARQASNPPHTRFDGPLTDIRRE